MWKGEGVELHISKPLCAAWSQLAEPELSESSVVVFCV